MLADSGLLAFQLIAGAVCGIVAAAIASNKGRSAIGWFFGGFFLGLIGVVIVSVISNPRKERELRQQLDQERHRLREQLRQERLKGEAYRQYSAQRLDAHDQVLGVDTRSQAALPGAEPAFAELTAEPEPTLEQSLTNMASQAQPQPAALQQPGLIAPAMGAQQPLAPQAGPMGAVNTFGISPMPVAGPAQQPAPRPSLAVGRQWYYEVKGASMGPVTEGQLKSLMQARSVTAQTLIWTEGFSEWVTAGRIRNFQPLLGQ